jgi:hypothetical protein
MREVRRLAPWPLAFGGYAALTVAITWPLAAHLSSKLPHDAIDPALNTWILWWNAHALPLTSRWWNAPNFWPARGALSLSEHLLGISVLTTPLQWLGAQPLTAYNVALLISYPLTAIAAHALAFALVRRHDAAALSGLIFGFNPYRVAQLPHIQMLWVFGMPLALLALHRYLDTRERRWLAAFAGAWLIQALANGYLLLFFPVLLFAWVLWFAAGRSRLDPLRAIATTWVLASLPLLPMLWTYEIFHSSLNLARRAEEIELFSADVRAIVTTAPDMILWHRLADASQAEGQLFPGLLALALVAMAVALALFTRRSPSSLRSTRGGIAHLVFAGVTLALVAIALSPLAIGPWRLAIGSSMVLSVSSPEKPLSVALVFLVATLATNPSVMDAWRRRSALAFYTLAAVLMWAFSLGPRPRVYGMRVLFNGPYSVLLSLPGFASIRVPARFAMLAVLCLAVAAALAFARLTARLERRGRYALAVLCAGAVIAESWPATTLAAPPPAIRALRRAAAGPVIELPLGITERDAAAEYRSIDHGHPLVNGYSGYEPPTYRVLSLALGVDDGDVLKELAAGEPLSIVLDRGEQFDRWSRLVTAQRAEIVADEGDWRIYRLSGDPRSNALIDGAPLTIRGLESNVGRELVGRMVDGNVRTEWNSRRTQIGGEQVVLDLGSDHRITAVRMTFGPFYYDYPRRLSIDCAADGADWQPCFSGSISRFLFRGMLADPRSATAAIPLERDHVRRLRLTQTAVEPLNGWSIAELAVLGR